jgi:hypothetical protein
VAALAILVLLAGHGGLGQVLGQEKTQAQQAWMTPKAKEALDAADARAAKYLAEMERAYREHLAQCRSRDTLRPYVRELLGVMQKVELGKDLATSAATKQRLAKLFREKVLDDAQLARIAGDFAELYGEYLAHQDATVLVELGIDADLAVTELSRSRFDAAEFRRHIERVIDASVTAAQNDVARFAATWVVSDVLAGGAKELGRGLGLMPQDRNSLESQIAGFLLEAAIGAIVDQVTDPTEQIVGQLATRLKDAEDAMLIGTAKNPGLFRALRTATSQRSELRRQVLREHLSK